jgi:hypothetical protein
MAFWKLAEIIADRCFMISMALSMSDGVDPTTRSKPGRMKGLPVRGGRRLLHG